MNKISFTIPDLPKTPNATLRKHWAIVMREARRWHTLVGYHVCRHAPKTPYTQAKLTLIRYSMREPDHDGLVGSFKWVIDGLVKHKIIIDDKTSVIGKSEYQWQKAKKEDQRIEVIIEPLA